MQRELGRQYHLITRDDRLEVVAKDIVHHFLGRGFQGKAMVVSIDKATALRMYDKVRRHWEFERKAVEEELKKLSHANNESEIDRVLQLQQRLHSLKKHQYGSNRLAGTERSRANESAWSRYCSPSQTHE